VDERPKSEALPVREEEKFALENEESPRALEPKFLLSKLFNACDDETVEPVIERLLAESPRELEFVAARLSLRDADEVAPFRAPPKEFHPVDRPELAAEEAPRYAISPGLRFDIAERPLLATLDEFELLPAELPNECQLPSATAGRAFDGMRLDVL
jgi:hypothetical protein